MLWKELELAQSLRFWMFSEDAASPWDIITALSPN